MTDPLDRLRSATPTDPFDQDGVRSRLADTIAGQRAGSTTRRRRTAVYGTVTGGLACAGVATGLVLGASAPAAPDGSVVQADGPTSSATASAAEIRTVAAYVQRSVSALDSLETSELILQIDRTEPGTHTETSREYIAGDGTASMFVGDPAATEGPVTESRQLLGPDGTMRYTMTYSDGTYSTFDLSVQEYSGPDASPLEEQLQQQVAELRKLTAGLTERQEAGTGWTLLGQRDIEVAGAPSICLDYRYDPDQADPSAPQGVKLALREQQVCLDAATLLPVQESSAYEMQTEPSTITYTWLQATAENRAALVPEVTGLREVAIDDEH